MASKLKRMSRVRPKRDVRSENVLKIIDALRVYAVAIPEEQEEAWEEVVDLVKRATPSFFRAESA